MLRARWSRAASFQCGKFETVSNYRGTFKGSKSVARDSVNARVGCCGEWFVSLLAKVC